MKDHTLLKLISVISILGLLTSCSAVANKVLGSKGSSGGSTPVIIEIKNPTLSFSNYKSSTSEKKINITLNYIANNPGKVAFKDVSVSYQLIAEGVLFKANTIKGIVLDANKNTKISIPVTVVNSELKKIVGKEDKVDVLAKVTMFAASTTSQGMPYSFNIKLDNSIEISVFQEKENRNDKDDNKNDRDEQNDKNDNKNDKDDRNKNNNNDDKNNNKNEKNDD